MGFRRRSLISYRRSRSGKNKSSASTTPTAETSEPILSTSTIEKVEEKVEQKASELAALAPSLPDVISDLTARKDEAEAVVSNTIDSASERVEEAVASVNSTTTTKPKKGKKSKKIDSTHLPSTSFSPTLPDSLPVPSSPNAAAATTTDDRTDERQADVFNSNHKRPAPTEFSLDNKGAASPPSKGVKFEDGLSPGQGKDGETVIPGVGRYTKEELAVVKDKLGKVADVVQEKKKSNAFERTVWTLIMITFFLGTSTA